jgi:hypothetical protein
VAGLRDLTCHFANQYPDPAPERTRECQGCSTGLYGLVTPAPESLTFPCVAHATISNMSNRKPTRRTPGTEFFPTPDKASAYDAGVEFQVLGPLEVTQDGSPVSLGGTKQRTVLALLLASISRPVSTYRLIEGVYGDEAPKGCAAPSRRSSPTSAECAAM